MKQFTKYGIEDFHQEDLYNRLTTELVAYTRTIEADITKDDSELPVIKFLISKAGVVAVLTILDAKELPERGILIRYLLESKEPEYKIRSSSVWTKTEDQRKLASMRKNIKKILDLS